MIYCIESSREIKLAEAGNLLKFNASEEFAINEDEYGFSIE